jgi:activator of HSP90 ATPase
MTTNDRGESWASRRQVIGGLAAGAAVVATAVARAEATAEITLKAQAIHQEAAFKAPRNRVYSLLTDEREFQKVVALSEAVKSGKVKTTPAAQIGREAGAAFSIFGGFIEGRNIELVPDTRLVQVWRPKYWPAGIYSIARFELKERPGGTLMVFDHTGFPADDAASLAQGWKQNYWQPMTLVLAQ